ncbi:ATP-binding protein [Kribbella deserti]|uniref:Tetratricopeptide repeat protein n=1 Tax=Kribbella deserti TaxID=1926257 RepID=A0ABV6QMM1_9ACTN
MESQFAALLRRHRQASGLTQDELADRCGLSQEAISTLERGTRRHPQRSTLLALADALELDPDQRAALEAAASRRGRRTSAREAPKASVRPRQLPLAAGDFTGRATELRQIADHLSTTDRDAAVVAVTGMGGIGKTTLAVHAAHAASGRFDDGQLYLDLRGFGHGSPLEPLEALTAILSTLGVASEELPTNLGAAVARYRTLAAKRRFLFVVDNALDAAQVQPLLPVTAGSAAIVTSRRSLSGLDGLHLQLGVPPVGESIELLQTVAGRDFGLEPAAADVVDQCGGLPLAVRMAGARLASRPNWPVRHLADRLADERRRLDELEIDHAGVRATLALSIEQLATSEDPLDVRAARYFALLGLADGPDLSVRLVAALADSSEDEAGTVLGRLVDVHLLSSQGTGQYRLHDLLRVSAMEYAEQVITQAERATARDRWLERVLAVVWRASEFATHGQTRETWLDPAWLKPSQDLTSEAEVFAWLDAEQPALVDTVRRTAVDSPAVAIRLAIGLNAYCAERKLWLDWLHVNEAVVELVAAGNDPIAEGVVRHDLGAAQAELGQFELASEHLRLALAAADRSADHGLQVLCLSSLSHALERLGRYAEGIPYAERARRLGLRIGHPGRTAYACLALGMLYLKTGDTGRARDRFDEALALGAAAGPRGDHGMIALNIGVAYREAGQYGTAAGALQQSLALFRAADRPLAEAEALNELGVLAFALGNHSEAVLHYSEGLAIAGQYGDWLREATIRRHLGEVHQAQGHPTEARREWRLALTIHQSHGIRATTLEELLAAR